MEIPNGGRPKPSHTYFIVMRKRGLQVGMSDVCVVREDGLLPTDEVLHGPNTRDGMIEEVTKGIAKLGNEMGLDEQMFYRLVELSRLCSFLTRLETTHEEKSE